jgi:GDP-L-fucose synthase
MISEFWAGKRILVTGAHGFVGRHLCKQLVIAGAQVFEPIHCEFDLTSQSETAEAVRWNKNAIPQIIIHLAANVGGIGYNQLFPGDLFRDNILMGVNIIHEAAQWANNGLEKLVVIGTTCAYPKMTPIPFKESDLWNGYPEETNASYGIAKRALLTMCQAYRQQYGLNAIYLLPANLYGPGDNFDNESSHVIPAMIRKFVDARDSKTESVTLWGDGSATREFLYIEDCVRGIILATEKYDNGEPVNLGTGNEITISNLARMIANLVGFTGFIRWDSERPNGQPRRRLDTSRSAEFGFSASMPIMAGLRETIKWYEEHGND